jgi:hypothetical protein
LITCDRRARNSVVRVSKDYRPALAVVKPYPRGRSTPSKTHLSEARTNIRFVWKLRGHASRFSDGGWPVLYTAQRPRTACAEVGYHLQEVYLPAKLPGKEISVPHIIYKLRVSGKRRDLSFDPVLFPTLCGSGPAEMDACQNIARQALSDGMGYLLAPSARALGQRCYPILSRKVATKPFGARPLQIAVWDDLESVVVRFRTRVDVVPISRDY